MSVLSKDEMMKGVYLYTAFGDKITKENIEHIIFDLDTIGNIVSYDLTDDERGLIIFTEDYDGK